MRYMLLASVATLPPHHRAGGECGPGVHGGQKEALPHAQRPVPHLQLGGPLNPGEAPHW
jgi:hypothetical protein